MTGIITGVTLGEAIEPRLTVDGLRNLLLDLRRARKPLPKAILVSEYDRRELNQDLLAGAANDVDMLDKRPEHDLHAIGVIEGVIVRAHPDIARGKARLIFGPRPVPKAGKGLVIVGA